MTNISDRSFEKQKHASEGILHKEADAGRQEGESLDSGKPAQPVKNETGKGEQPQGGEGQSEQFPDYGVLLGVDFGTKRVGVAVSTREQTIASPLCLYQRRTEQTDAAFFRRLVQEYRVVGIVVGLPVHMSGEEGKKAREARQFGRWLAQVTGCPVRFWDERFTTALAEEALREGGLTRRQRHVRRDKLAAQFMLQSFLDSPDRSLPPVSLRPPPKKETQ